MTDDKTKVMKSEDTLRMSEKVEKKKPGYITEFGDFDALNLTVVRRLSANSGEAEIFLVERENQKYVLKLYYPTFSPSDEVLAKLKGIRHPNILHLFEYGVHVDRFFELLEYAEGGTLGDKKESGEYRYLPLSEIKVWEILQEILNAFEYCHTKGIIHRDIKPGNLFYKQKEGKDILVGDFGISSKVNVEEGMTKRKTKRQSRTEGYAAPEIYSSIIGKELDYYSLGITIFELLTGKNPFKGRNEQHIIRDTIQGRVADDFLSREEAKHLSPKMQTLLRGLLTVQHDKRWGLSEIKRFLTGEEVPVFKPIIQERKPFVINDIKLYEWKDIVRALEKDRVNGKKYLYRGMIGRWAEGIDMNFATKIYDIQEENNSTERQDYGLQRLLHFLDPELPYRAKNGREVRTYAEFLELLRSGDTEVVTELQDSYSFLNAWLLQNNLDGIREILQKCSTLGYDKKKTLLYILYSLEDSFSFEDRKIFHPEEILDWSVKSLNKLYTQARDENSEFSIWFSLKSEDKYKLWNSGVEKNLETFLELLSGEWDNSDEGGLEIIELFGMLDEENPKTYTNSLGMEFVLIPAGEFMMGAVPQDKEELEYEQPQAQHKIKITKSFYLGKYPVTQREWKKLMGNNPSEFKNAGSRAPVENISWNDCKEFIKKLNQKEGKTYRLPLEAEWEYAARGGGSGIYTFGDDVSKLGEYAWYRQNSKNTKPVGKKKPNTLGLYDIMGNVFEWCEDWYDIEYYKNSPMDDPKGPEEGVDRVLRGGSWDHNAEFCRLSYRESAPPDYSGIVCGFRLVLLP